MTHELISITPLRPLQRASLDAIPALFANAGERAAVRVIEFFTANIRNPNTRAAYALAVRRFADWCQAKGYALSELTPIHIAGYVEELGKSQEHGGAGLAKPTVKQHLAALRMLFDYLVTGQVVPHNPATAVRGPKYVLKRGKTPVLTAEEARLLLDTILPARATVLAVDSERRTLTVKVEGSGREKVIEVTDAVRLQAGARGKTFRLAELMPGEQLRVVQRRGTVAALRCGGGEDALADLRDRALIGVMCFSFARIGAVLGMNIEDYYQQGKRWWIRLHEKGGKHHELPAHHLLEAYLDVYLDQAKLRADPKGPLFRTIDSKRQLTGKRLLAREALAMIKRRACQAGLGERVCCHTFRATGITNYLENGGTVEKAQQIACHESPRTTKLYDRTNDHLSLDEIERIKI